MGDTYTRNLGEIKDRLASLNNKLSELSAQVDRYYFGLEEPQDCEDKEKPTGLIQEIDYLLGEVIDTYHKLEQRLTEMGVFA